MIQATWTHLLARTMVRPLVETGVTPNHLTTLAPAVRGRRMRGARAWHACGRLVGGDLWLLSAFLDQADGELARIGDMMSEAGHRYDFTVDNLVTTAFFVAIGIGLRGSWLGTWSVPLGLAAGGCLLLGSWWSERLETRTGRVARAYSGRWSFDLDDLLYLMAPLAWLEWLAPILVGAALGTAIMAVITGIRLCRLPQSA